MAINPEQVHEAVALVEYKEWTSSGATDHRVVRLGHVEPWHGWASDNRLETTWNSIPQGRTSGPMPFQAEARPINSGTGKVELKWRVWDDSSKLTNLEVELYSVMRAENRFIGEGFIKLGSKYVQTLYLGGAPIEVENCGVDSFFLKRSDQSCVFCESKFTRAPAKFEGWMDNPQRVWRLMGRGKGADGRPCRQMSWEWIHDRAGKALKRPTNLEGASSSQVASIVEHALQMLRAARERRGKRFVNIFGAAQVPVYPGIYLFVSGEGGTPSINELHIEWPIPQNPREFIELGQEFDDWLQSQSSHTSAPAPSSIVLP